MSPKKTALAPSIIAPILPLLSDDDAFEAALDALGCLDPVFTGLPDGASRPKLRRRDAGFEGLAWIIVSQQVSTASASAIFARVKSGLGTVSAERIHATSDEDLKACGLSGPKLKALRAVAAAVTEGALDFAALRTLDAEAAHAMLVAIRGVGPWTADIFLLFCLGHADAWPAGDLALQEAARLVLGLPVRPDARTLLALGERWRPFRGVAAHWLWAYYRSARGRAAPLDTAPASPRRARQTEV